MPFNVTVEKVTSEGFFLEWTQVPGASSYLMSLEDEGISCEICYIVSGLETGQGISYPIEAGRKYRASVKAYAETVIGQPGAGYGLMKIKLIFDYW